MDESASACSHSDRYEQIYDTGDLILLLGPHQAPLKVQSRCLRTASKPKPVDLSDDDFGAMHTVCCVIHHRNDLLTPTLDPADLLRVAIVVDKYDLSVAMKFALAQWLKLRDDMDMIQLGFMLAAAYRLRHEELFEETTLALIIRCDASYWCLPGHEIINEVFNIKTPGKVLYVLEERRNRMRADILRLLGSSGPKCSCGWGKVHAQGREKRKARYGPLDLLKTPLSQIIDRLERIPLGEWRPGRRDRHHEEGCSSVSGAYIVVDLNKLILLA
ncbi:uncharacterized protein B0I36DRAFT_342942 [Microdochium trichocladiopsis]|uniref:BTB domain-containing protein n=1 Tax=Microdochium trichocladiopsis TaxID=1682393 RepID=A0A9P9BH04_9PEZI|nr:uncharacterized protein B0I36DRAFT_342942 [Microdochium trichocladiopsis]KAH7009109.1 hypothetical protein B0I36DRAFT_342942 [Microdochium trichocladiopsis]